MTSSFKYNGEEVSLRGVGRMFRFLCSIAGFITQVWAQVLTWAWFVRPLFPVPALTFWSAVGLSLTCRVLLGGLSRYVPEPPDDERNYRAAFYPLVYAFAIGFSWVIRFWVMP